MLPSMLVGEEQVSALKLNGKNPQQNRLLKPSDVTFH